MLETEPDLKVVGEAGNGLEAVQLAERLKPDVLVVDLLMDGMNGIEATRWVKQVSPQTKTIVLSMYNSDAYVFEAVKAGARGYVLKGGGIDELVHAIRRVLSGYCYLSAPMTEARLEEYGRKTRSAEATS